MKKIILINLFACAALLGAYFCANHAESTYQIKYSTDAWDAKSSTIEVVGGGEKEEQLFQFNRIYIKL